MHVKDWFESNNHDSLVTGWPEESSGTCPNIDLC